MQVAARKGASQGERRDVVERGLLDGLSRILREVLQAEQVKQTIRTLLSAVDPEGAAKIVRAAAQTEPALLLDLVGSAPALVNASVTGTAELLRIVAGLPRRLVAAAVARALEELDGERLGELGGLCWAQLARLAAEQEVAAALAGLRREIVEGFERTMAGAEADNAELVDRALRPLAAAVARALAAATDAEHEARRGR